MVQKVVINTCYGGFSLSTACIREWAKRQEREAYFFVSSDENKYVPVEEVDLFKRSFVKAFDVPNPNEYEMNDLEENHYIDDRPIRRDDELLISVIEDLGADFCSGSYASLKVVEVPDDVCWNIEEYDGVEWVAEVHRVWR
jgi:hypothetical protein